MESSHMDQSFTCDPELDPISHSPHLTPMENVSEVQQELYELKRKNDLYEKMLREMPHDVKSFLADPESVHQITKELENILKEELGNEKFMELTQLSEPLMDPTSSQDPDVLEIKAFYDAKLAKYHSENGIPLKKKLLALQQEMVEFEEARDRELDELQMNLQQLHEETSDPLLDTSESNEECLWYMEQIKVMEESTENLRQQNDADELLVERLQQEYDTLKETLSTATQKSASLRQQIEDLEEEAGVLQSALVTARHRSATDRDHLPRGNSVFAEAEDSKNSFLQKIKLIKSAHARELNTKANLQRQLLVNTSKKRNVEKCFQSQMKECEEDNVTSKYLEKALEGASKLESLVPCPPFQAALSSPTLLSGLEKINQQREKVEALRRTLAQKYRGRLDTIQHIYKQKMHLFKLNHQAHLVDVDNKNLMSEIAHRKSVQSQPTCSGASDKNKKRGDKAVSFNVPSGSKEICGRADNIEVTDSVKDEGKALPVRKMKGRAPLKFHKVKELKSLDDLLCLVPSSSQTPK